MVYQQKKAGSCCAENRLNTYLGIGPYGKVQGIMVDQVDRGSRAWANGLRPGDIIASVNQQPVSHLKEFFKLVNQEKSALLLHVLRGNSAAFMVAK
ncbi:MAG: PDZ domain-containing protein [Gammaproteobacteria bacterium]